MQVRPMTPADVEVCEQISDLAFYEVDRATATPAAPAPRRRTPDHSARWAARTRGTLATDPGGCWVSVDEAGTVIGFAVGFRREDLWCLATYAVLPGHQGQGVGRPLLDTAMQYGEGCSRAMLSASSDPKALRRYHRAGFALHPQLHFTGRVDREARVAASPVRDGEMSDRGWMDDLDRRLRGGPHGPDHAHLADTGTLLVAGERAGYAYTRPNGVSAIAARDEETARALLWECLARAEEPVELFHITDANRWAVDVALAAGLSMATSGFLGVRGMAPPAPYLHDGALL